MTTCPNCSHLVSIDGERCPFCDEPLAPPPPWKKSRKFLRLEAYILLLGGIGTFAIPVVGGVYTYLHDRNERAALVAKSNEEELNRAARVESERKDREQNEALKRLELQYERSLRLYTALSGAGDKNPEQQWIDLSFMLVLLQEQQLPKEIVRWLVEFAIVRPDQTYLAQRVFESLKGLKRPIAGAPNNGNDYYQEAIAALKAIAPKISPKLQLLVYTTLSEMVEAPEKTEYQKKRTEVEHIAAQTAGEGDSSAQSVLQASTEDVAQKVLSPGTTDEEKVVGVQKLINLAQLAKGETGNAIAGTLRAIASGNPEVKKLVEAAELSSPALKDMAGKYRGTVLLYIADDNQRAWVEKIRTGLQAKGFSVPEIENVRGRAAIPRVTEIRRYSHDDATKTAAVDTLEILKTVDRTPAQISFRYPAREVEFIPQRLEVWISSRDREPAPIGAAGWLQVGAVYNDQPKVLWLDLKDADKSDFKNLEGKNWFASGNMSLQTKPTGEWEDSQGVVVKGQEVRILEAINPKGSRFIWGRAEVVNLPQ
jgi:hypothetical protein